MVRKVSDGDTSRPRPDGPAHQAFPGPRQQRPSSGPPQFNSTRRAARSAGDGRSGTRRDLSGYTTRRVKFIVAYREAYEAAYLNPRRAAPSDQ